MHIVHSLHIAIYNLCLHKIIFLSFHKAKFSLVKVKENIFGNCGDKENLKKKKMRSLPACAHQFPRCSLRTPKVPPKLVDLK
jgi:hypothetical protein